MHTRPPGFIGAHHYEFQIDGRPFRFLGANVAIMYREDERAEMARTLRQAAANGISVVRVWASGEGSETEGVKPVGGDKADWPRVHPFQPLPGEWNEEAFVHLDNVLAEAARNHLRVQLCLANWWRDTGGVTQYLRWAGITGADDDTAPYGINVERAMLFYTNLNARTLYKNFVRHILERHNTVTARPYRDDATIFSYELMNEAQAAPGRWSERRAWIAEMSAYVRSLDPNHLITPGDWGYRDTISRREWIEDHRLSGVDYCDVHLYPRDDLDSFVDSPQALNEFIRNRVAAAFSLGKPLVIGEFGMAAQGYKGFSQTDWFRAYFDAAARSGAGGAMFWILTSDVNRGYGISFNAPRDEAVLAEVRHGAEAFARLKNEAPPSELRDSAEYLIPHQFSLERPENSLLTHPEVITLPDRGVLYRFTPEAAVQERFEKLGAGEGYVWGSGAGSFEYIVPKRDDWRYVGRIVVRAHLQPVLPPDAAGRIPGSRVTLFVNGTNCGERLITPETAPAQNFASQYTQEWQVTSLPVWLRATIGRELRITFAVEADADLPYGLNISNFSAGTNPSGFSPVEVELRR